MIIFNVIKSICKIEMIDKNINKHIVYRINTNKTILRNEYIIKIYIYKRKKKIKSINNLQFRNKKKIYIRLSANIIMK